MMRRHDHAQTSNVLNAAPELVAQVPLLVQQLCQTEAAVDVLHAMPHGFLQAHLEVLDSCLGLQQVHARLRVRTQKCFTHIRGVAAVHDLLDRTAWRGHDYVRTACPRGL